MQETNPMQASEPLASERVTHGLRYLLPVPSLPPNPPACVKCAE